MIAVKFYLIKNLPAEFEDGLNQRLGSATEQERHDWVQAIRMAGYDLMRAQLQYLREQIEKRRGSHRLDVDVDMHRLQSGNQVLGEETKRDVVEDLIEFWYLEAKYKDELCQIMIFHIKIKTE